MKETLVKQLKNEPMRNHTTFKTGGPAETLYLPSSAEEVRQAVEYAAENRIPWCVVGRGSNLLVSDKGYPGAVIKIADRFARIEINGNKIYAEAGALLRDITAKCIENSLSGLEFAGGIPGALGGGVSMNAGAYGGELKDYITFVRVLTPEYEIMDIPCGDMQFGYRKSAVQQKGYIVLGAEFCLPSGDREASRDLLQSLNNKRKNCQPLNYPSAGSTFKRPTGYFAGTMIEQCGLKGCKIGGAQVSEKHAGFIINIGDATSEDIYKLICHVRDAVFQKTGVMLEPEVRMIGDFT
jgi:UDP-N-acetylmuramate dehydrogenase